jgi:methionyl-tRNA formyltransferase
VKECAIEKNIPILQPITIRGNREFLEELRTYNCDYFIVVAYGKILPVELLQIPNKKCINIHGSILPKYRGASPIQAVLFA